MRGDGSARAVTFPTKTEPGTWAGVTGSPLLTVSVAERRGACQTLPSGDPPALASPLLCICACEYVWHARDGGIRLVGAGLDEFWC